MADPLTALIHAVQVMNFLKTLITKTLLERENSAAMDQTLPPSADFPCHSPEVLATNKLKLSRSVTLDRWESEHYHPHEGLATNKLKLSRSITLDRWESEKIVDI